MNQSWCAAILLMVFSIAGCAEMSASRASGNGEPTSANTVKLTPTDLSTIRGVNYRGAGAADTTDYWRHYNAAETQRDLGYADRLNLNQVRVFVNDASWQADKPAFRKNLVDLARACNQHRIGLMITVGDTQSFIDQDRSINQDRIDLLVTELVTAVTSRSMRSWLMLRS